jgi:prepilin-type N-terminal cleavage/methylation domain-containing protein
MARPHSNDRGFTLIEMLTVVLITGILSAISLPYLYKEKSLANTVPQIESTFKVVNLKARANSGNPYRITLRTTTGATSEQFLKIDYAVNNNCTPINNAASITAWENSSSWRQDPTQTLVIPSTVQISNFPPKGFCFSGKGEVVLSPGFAAGTTRTFDVSYIGNRSSSKAKKATINISVIGDVSRKTYDSLNAEISPTGKLN